MGVSPNGPLASRRIDRLFKGLVEGLDEESDEEVEELVDKEPSANRNSTSDEVRPRDGLPTIEVVSPNENDAIGSNLARTSYRNPLFELPALSAAEPTRNTSVTAKGKAKAIYRPATGTAAIPLTEAANEVITATYPSRQTSSWKASRQPNAPRSQEPSSLSPSNLKLGQWDLPKSSPPHHQNSPVPSTKPQGNPDPST
ncbi:hypothetical protein QCA50_007952 [Cerrena zonata]|uniref:Uncharacterized protein n=1 Tax=Cerrena zonata TaxID=2478898 RepID=A0AAW0G922_9APHY